MTVELIRVGDVREPGRLFDEGDLSAAVYRFSPHPTPRWHHHGDYHVVVQVISGSVRVESGPGGSIVTEAEAGDLLYLRPRTIHRETYEGDEDITLLSLWFGAGPDRIDVDGPDQESPERPVSEGGRGSADDAERVQIVGIHHVQLAMPPGEEELARRFYRGVLGLREIPKPPTLAGRGGCWFAGPNTEIHLGVEEGFVPARKAHPALAVSDLDAVAGRLQQSGASVQPDDLMSGVRRLYTSDPFGNRIELIEALTNRSTDGSERDNTRDKHDT